MTESQIKALRIAAKRGVVFAGTDVSGGGSVVRTSASTIKALAAKGFVTLALSPDGGMCGRITDEGRAAALANE